MGLALHRMSFADFLAWEQAQPDRHEFHRGEVFAMVGGTARHNRVILNLATALLPHLDGTPCQLFTETMKLALADETVLYPDLMVACGGPLAGDEQAIANPKLVVEVLSPSTRGYDKRDKFMLYRSLPSLREYALVDPSSRAVEVFTWTDAGWLLADQTGRAELRLASVALQLPQAELFKGVALAA
jgi:Uma2 family endonuclease